MPINVSAFIGHGTGNCSCYRCRVQRELSGFSQFCEALKIEFGGMLPRNYDQSKGLNNPERLDSNDQPVPLTLETVDLLKAQISQITSYNKGRLETLTATMRVKHAYCYDCGKIHRKDLAHTVQDHGVAYFICADCVRTSYKLCEVCNSLKRRHLFTRVSSQSAICTECFNRKYYRCNRCDNSFLLGDEYRFTFTTGTRSIPHVLCPGCRTTLRVCGGCGHHFFESERNFTAHRGLCGQCYQDRSSIKSYSYKPVPKFKDMGKGGKLREDTLMTGVEWELENCSMDSRGIASHDNEWHANALTDVMGEGFQYYKRDGSLSSGFEIVTHPFSWDFYTENKARIGTQVETAHANGLRAKSSCGIHIHMTKKAFSYAHLYKFVKFIYDIKNRPFMVELSQRGQESSYAAFRGADTCEMAKFAKRKTNVSGDRHSAVNCTGPNTIEVRFFGSTTNKTCFFKNIEFVYALYEYTSDCSFKHLKVADFICWLAKRANANKYRNLALWLKDNALSSDDKRTYRRWLKKNHVNLNLKKGE